MSPTTKTISDGGGRDRYDWAGRPSTDTVEVMQQYDEFAPVYDQIMLDDWGYKAPATAATILARHLRPGAEVLDAGCGTGLTGLELSRCGLSKITGVDISQLSLALAQDRGIYNDLRRADLNEPLPFDSKSFDAAQCIGVLSYIEGDHLLRELCRVVRPEGLILLSQRTDLSVKRDFPLLLQHLCDEGLWTIEHSSNPMSYMPGHLDFGEDIKVLYFLTRVI